MPEASRPALLTDESGQSLVEYVLIVALVGIGLILVALVFRDAVGRVFAIVTDTLNQAEPPCVQKGKSHKCF